VQRPRLRPMLLDRFAGFRPLEIFSSYGFEWRTPTKRLAVGVALTNGATGIWFAIFQVQGWTMPKPLAIALLIPVGATIVASLAVVVVDIARNLRAFREHRATNVPWVVSEPPGLLDYEPDGVRAQDRLTAEFEKLTEDTRIVGMKVEKARDQIPRLGERNIFARQRWANRTARSINHSAIYIENRLAMLKLLVREIERDHRGLIETTPLETSEQIDTARLFRDTLNGSRAATSETAASVEEYREAVEGVESQNVSRSLRIAANRLGNALGGVARTLRSFEKVAAERVKELDRRLAQKDSVQ
jgi:hypothetical protein